MTLLHLIEQAQHREQLARILHSTDPTPDMLHAAAERPRVAGGKTLAILLKHRARGKHRRQEGRA